MAALQQDRAEYELSKYLQLFNGDDAQTHAVQAALRGSFNGHVELSIMRLGVYGAFLVLNDATRLHLLASGHRGNGSNDLSQVDFDHGKNDWLQIEGADRMGWISLVRELTTTNSPGSDLKEESSFSITDFQQDHRTANLSAAKEFTNFSFLAGFPLTSKNGLNIRAICVIDQKERPPLSAAESSLLAHTARTCMELLELARARDFNQSWSAVQAELDIFVRSQKGVKEDGTQRVESDISAEVSLLELGHLPIEGGESKRLVDAETERNHRIAARKDDRGPEILVAKGGQNDKREAPKGETAYRKVFRRAAECLRSALEADGVLVAGGLIGFHGSTQPVVQPELELESYMDNLAMDDKTPLAGDETCPSDDATHNPRPDSPGTHTRLYTSAEYLRGVYVQRPAEILGFCGSHEDLELVRVSESTLGLPQIDEGFLQRLMERHPNGALWHSSTTGLTQVKDETLVEIDLDEEARKLALVFKNAKQLIFKPLTDPTSLKRLGACIAWRNKPIPVFTDAFDLRSLKAFMHVVESEIARYDASLAAKQKETFVASVSHELRTLLHGILGAMQLLVESGLDSTQKPLAEMIKTCGSTLHETLTSVLSYAKINQFERRQHQHRERHPPDAVQALSEKHGLASGPDRNYEGLYICSNLALLCEETVSVLEAGKSFYNPHGDEVTVVCSIEHEENWSYFTEPGAIRRIAINLIGNALKYTNKGLIIVTLSAARMMKDKKNASNDITGRTFTLTVKDTGKGMSKDFMDNQLFLPFTQEDSNSAQGVGLGMSIVKSLVSLLGGEIEVQSAVERGTEIQVRVPMGICTPDDNDKGQTALQFERDVRNIRDQKLSAVMYGFPKSIRESLTNYLCNWFNCTLLEPTIDARPDIVLVEEGIEEVLQAVRETSRGYGKNGVLLSIVTVPSMMGQRMETLDGYPKWERVPRPLGPKSVANALISCLEKLHDLRKYGENISVDNPPKNGEQSQHQDDSIDLQVFKEGLPYERYLPDSEKEKIAEALQVSSASKSSNAQQSLKEKQRSSVKKSISAADDPKAEARSESASDLRILVVDDNALNLRLLGAFLKRNDNRDVKQAKNGKEAVEAVQSSEKGFDIIFMDLSMPVMDGFEATRQIRKMESDSGNASTGRRIFIIALTGLASQEDEDGAFSAGVDMFLTKPVQFLALSRLLQQYAQGTLRPKERST
ncbi:hypothetical protein DE146DRAFT_760575 [Phaeosphaeria sp. MPI-PUGE-AT-0046c]|nr:hypothetical protein DE146DRAFT_760575 [Phaeosphaeria sp. MPI-PUGE-AT-0046c]